LVPSDWIRRTTTLVTPFAQMDQTFEDSPPTVGRWGDGYLWWVWDALDASDPLAGAFAAWVVGGHYMTLLPKLHPIAAHKTNTATARGVSAPQYDVIPRIVAAARRYRRPATARMNKISRINPSPPLG